MALKFTPQKDDAAAAAQPKQPGAPDDGSVAQKIDEILHRALASGATEVHFEPSPERTRVRMRVHGRLVDFEALDARLHGKLINRIKIMGGMDISKRGVAQRGYTKVEAEQRAFDLVAIIVPTPTGEKALVRINYMTALGLTLDQLGMFPQILNSLKKLLDRPNGLLLIAGPPGSGRTTTAYTCLQYLNRPERNVSTFEPDIRYQIPGVIQGKPDARYDYGWLDGLRATIDMEPDILYVGHLNDDDTARTTLAAAFGKRMVLARINAKNGPTAMMQLLDMGLPGFLVASGVIGVLSQRLVRRLCEACREPYKPADTILTELGVKPHAELTFYAAKGCGQCSNTGFRGSIGIFELFIPNEKVQEKLIARASAQELQTAATETGFLALRLDGMSKVSRGLTTLEEVLARL
jgi:type II secretory ATPase GspE/PulE/Tfp pilus assembly ATPase PilB-like protein